MAAYSLGIVLAINPDDSTGRIDVAVCRMDRRNNNHHVGVDIDLQGSEVYG
jgi:hypothetical protein